MAVIKHATFETNLDGWSAWYGCTIARDNADVQTGSWSALATTTAGDGSALHVDNYPYIPGVVAGQNYDLSIWYRYVAGTFPGDLAWRLVWKDAAVATIRTDQIPMPAGTGWTQTTATLTAPVGTETVKWEITWTGSVDDAFRADNIIQQDAATGQSIPIGQSIETDTAGGIAPAKARAIGQALPAETTGSITPSKNLPIGQAGEVDAARAVVASKALPLGQAVEVGTANTITGSTAGAQTVPIGQAAEADTALAILPAKTHSVGTATETDTASSIIATKVVILGQAAETDTAAQLVASKARTIGQALETDTAGAILTAPPSVWPPTAGPPDPRRLATAGPPDPRRLATAGAPVARRMIAAGEPDPG